MLLRFTLTALLVTTLGACDADPPAQAPDIDATSQADTPAQQADTPDADVPPTGLAQCPADWTLLPYIYLAGSSFPNIPGVFIAATNLALDTEVSGAYTLEAAPTALVERCNTGDVKLGCTPAASRVLIGTEASVDLSISQADLALIPTGTAVTARLSKAGDQFELDDAQGPLLMALRLGTTIDNSSPYVVMGEVDAMAFGPLQIALGDQTCVTPEDPCQIAWASRSLRVTATGVDVDVAVGATSEVVVDGDTYRIHLARVAERVEADQPSCAIGSNDQLDFWVMRVPTQ